MRDLRFCRYGHGFDLPMSELIVAVKDSTVDDGLVARAENSGSEGCYIEVARWNKDAQRWQRYAFLKVFGGEDLTLEEQDEAEKRDNGALGSVATAQRIAAHINASFDGDEARFIHTFPNWGN